MDTVKRENNIYLYGSKFYSASIRNIEIFVSLISSTLIIPKFYEIK